MSMSGYQSTKSYNPTSRHNQARVWKAQQLLETEQRREEERMKELRAERAELERASNANRVRGAAVDEELAKLRSVAFLYEAPASMQRASSAAAAVAAVGGDGDGGAESREIGTDAGGAVGQQGTAKQSKTQRQIMEERFPYLRNAPMDRAARENPSMALSYKPLGRVIRNVKCTRCGQFGHRSGERECPMLGNDPQDYSNKLREDPMASKRALVGQELTSFQQRTASFILKRKAGSRSPIVGGFAEDDPLQQILEDDAVEEADGERIGDGAGQGRTLKKLRTAGTGEDDEFLESLSIADLKLLLREMKQADEDDDGNSSSSSSSGSSSDDGGAGSGSGDDSDSDVLSRRRTMRKQKNWKKKKGKKKKTKKEKKGKEKHTKSKRKRQRHNDRRKRKKSSGGSGPR